MEIARVEGMAMLGTNSQFEVLLHQLDDEIGRLERVVQREGASGGRGALLEEMWARRQTLRQLRSNRRAEASKRVVDFRKWCDGDGAIQRFTAQLARHADMTG